MAQQFGNRRKQRTNAVAERGGARHRYVQREGMKNGGTGGGIIHILSH